MPGPVNTSSLPRPVKLGYRPALDGLRGVAILAVLGINADWPFLQGGFFGVDVFFVLSGFLITTLLLEENRDNGRIDLGRFFKRRAIRLMPALFTLLVFASAYTLFFRPPELRVPAFEIIAAALFYVSNWVIGVGHVHGTLEHTWSLAVEGQFYLLWAVGLSFALRKGVKLQRLLLLSTLLIIAVAIWRSVLWLQTGDVFRVYMGFDTRADSLLVGCVVAFIVTLGSALSITAAWKRLDRFLVPLAWIVLLIGFVCFKYYSPSAYLGGFSAMAVAAGLILFHAVQASESLTIRFLKWQPLMWFGRVSYSIYLWHVPLKNVFASERLQPILHFTIAVELARFLIFVGIGCISYYGIERPFLRLKKHVAHTSPAPRNPSS